MNLQNIKQKLNKVNNFYTYLEENKDIISKIDYDSLLDYIRQLYTACFDETLVTSDNNSKKEVELPAEKVVNSDNNKETVADKKAPILVFNSAEKEVTVEETVKEDAPKLVEKTTEEVVVEPVVNKEVEKKTEAPIIKEEPIITTNINEEYEELFMFKAATDISQKLSEAPVKDLNKAVALNEKFVYINELFGGDIPYFQATLKTFNEDTNFENVRSYMESNLIGKYNWIDNAKKNIAKDFIKLVRRRYL